MKKPSFIAVFTFMSVCFILFFIANDNVKKQIHESVLQSEMSSFVLEKRVRSAMNSPDVQCASYEQSEVKHCTVEFFVGSGVSDSFLTFDRISTLVNKVFLQSDFDDYFLKSIEHQEKYKIRLSFIDDSERENHKDSPKSVDNVVDYAPPGSIVSEYSGFSEEDVVSNLESIIESEYNLIVKKIIDNPIMTVCELELCNSVVPIGIINHSNTENNIIFETSRYFNEKKHLHLKSIALKGNAFVFVFLKDSSIKDL